MSMHVFTLPRVLNFKSTSINEMKRGVLCSHLTTPLTLLPQSKWTFS